MIENMFKYAVECDSLYNVLAILIICTLLGFVAAICYKAITVVAKLIQYITNKISKYKEIHTKVKCKLTTVEIDLHRRNKNGTE